MTLELQATRYANAELLEDGLSSLPYGMGFHHNCSGKWSVPVFDIDYASGSDYSGGSVARANYRAIEKLVEGDEKLEKFVVYSYGAHGTQGVSVRLDLGDLPESLCDIISGLANYPVIDESLLSELEMEEEAEAWTNFGASDFRAALRSYADEADEDMIDELDDDKLYELYRQAAEAENVYVEHTVEGPWFGDFDRLAKATDIGSIRA